MVSSVANETDKKMMEILRILSEHEEILGAKAIAKELKKKGYNLGERAVRYHMRILDEKGFTKRIGYSGRKITKKGLKEIEKGLVYDQVNFIFSKFEEMIHHTSFNPNTGKGKVVVNTSEIPPEALPIIKKAFKEGLCVSPHARLEKIDEKYKIVTVCGTTIDGLLLKEGIPIIPSFAGLVEIENYTPKRFTEFIAYKKTSMMPLEAFTAGEMTSVLDVIKYGEGRIPANFRLIPETGREKALRLLDKLQKMNIGGVLKVGEAGKNLLGMPVDDGMVGIAIMGGITPICAAQEAGHDISIKMAETLVEFSKLDLITRHRKLLKEPGTPSKEKVRILLTKAWNLIQQVDFDPDTITGKVIANISILKKEDLNKALKIIKKVCEEKPEYSTSPYFRIIKLEGDRVGIASICSLTVDGVLINQGIMSTPTYSGLLEIKDDMRRFVELTAYNGSSVEPHEIYISKGMTRVYDSLSGSGRILASLREIPYVAREKSLKVVEKLRESGLNILKVGKTNEILYNAKVGRYKVGIVTPGGLNPLAAVKENGVEVKVKAVESLMDINKFFIINKI
ncbi:MAG: DUF128 domain-containing protein [Methanobacteriales archaeon]|nr:DUF128 domain-containing protein [Methanobacteriaceae archaeon]